VSYAKIKDIEDLLSTGEDKYKVGKMFQQFMDYIFEKGAEALDFQSPLKQVFMRHLYTYSIELFYYMYYEA